MTRPAVLFPLLIALASGCRPQSPPVEATRPAVQPAPGLVPADALDRMDSRTAVPLLPMMANHQKQNMRDHLVAVQEITLALVTDDFPAVELAAAKLGYSEQMGQMCTHMGAGAPGFTEEALAFHHTADRIAAAAHARDRGRVVSELGATLQACTACHQKWKQRVVDEPTWTQLTATAPPMGHPSPH